MKATRMRSRVVVSGDGRGVVGHAGARLLADLADVTGLTGGFSDALSGLRRRDAGHDPGRVAVDVAVMIADGGEAISDLAVLRDQSGLFGSVASNSTAWRVLDAVDRQALGRLRLARAAARELAWAQGAETGRGLPASKAAGRVVPGLVFDIDASIVVAHSEKEQATPTWKKTFGFHPLFCFLDNTNEALSGILRQGRAGSNTAADHIDVLDQALAQIPDAERYGQPVLVRTDSAGASAAFLDHVRSLRAQGIDARFSTGIAIDEQIREAISRVPETQWIYATGVDGDFRDHAGITEITGMVTPGYLPEGTRLIVRREIPHPGAQLSLFDQVNGLRHQVTATDTPIGQGSGSIQFLETRHRAHARVEDRIRTGKDTGFGRFPSRRFAINQAWLELALTAIDLIAWAQVLLLDGDLAKCEPKRLRYRLLHVAARITRSARQTRLRIAEGWPWKDDLATAFSRLAALPRPVT